MTQTLQGALQQAIRNATGKTTQDFNGDLHDLCGLYGIPQAPISGRIIPLAQIFDSTISSSSAALNYLLQNSQTVVGPIALFSNGEQGAWYDPSDLTTLFDDSAGTTPVSAPGNGADVWVGLMLDKSKGLVLGSELVTNGDFASGGTGWTADASVSFTGGAAVFAASVGGAGIAQTLSVPAGAFSCSFTISGASAGGLTFRIRTAGGTIHATFSTENTALNKTYSFVLFPASASNRLEIISPGGAGSPTTLTLDNVTIKSLAGNHATSTGTKRPKLAARYNLLIYTEQFDNGAWTKNAVTAVNTTATTDPLGGTTADIITEAATTNYHSAYQGALITAGTTVAFSCYLKKGTWQYAQINAQSGSTSTRWFQCVIDLDTGTITQQSAGAAGTLVSATSTNAGNGWWRVVLTGSIPTDTTIFGMVGTVSGATPTLGAYGMESRLGSTSNTIYVWGADLRPASQSTGLIGPTYQRVVDAATYDTAGFLPYLQFDGIDDSMSTGSIDFTATDKMTVWAGVRKLSDAAVGQLVELSTAVSGIGIAGAFSMPASDGGATWVAAVRGSGSATTATATSLSAPITTVNTSVMDLAPATGDVQLRVNGTLRNTSTTDTGGGNFGNYPLFIGARNNASLYFQGWLTSLIVRGAQSTQSQIEATESWVNGKTGAY
jgi:hypothetical protein